MQVSISSRGQTVLKKFQPNRSLLKVLHLSDTQNRSSVDTNDEVTHSGPIFCSPRIPKRRTTDLVPVWEPAFFASNVGGDRMTDWSSCLHPVRA